MTWTAFFLVFGASILHASWNFISKSKRPSAAFYMLASMTSVLLCFPMLLFSGLDAAALPWRFWLCFLASGMCECIYFLGLFRAYSRSDISMAYPLARALPVLMTAAVTLLFGLGRAPGAGALFGMLVISVGCLLLPLRSLREFRLKSYLSPAVAAILIAAAGTTGYTVFDSMAVPYLENQAGAALFQSGAYLFGIESMIVIGLGFYVRSRPRERVAFRQLFL